MTCAQICQKHCKAVSVGAVHPSFLKALFPSQGDPMHLCEHCPLSSIMLPCCRPCARLFYIYTTTYSSYVGRYKHYGYKHYHYVKDVKKTLHDVVTVTYVTYLLYFVTIVTII